MHLVEPLAEALLEELHELAQVAHLGPEPLSQNLHRLLLALFTETLKHLPGFGCAESAAAQVFQSHNEIFDRWRCSGFLGHLDEEVEVVGEDAPGEELHTAEMGVFVKEGAEFLPLDLLQDPALVDHS